MHTMALGGQLSASICFLLVCAASVKAFVLINSSNYETSTFVTVTSNSLFSNEDNGGLSRSSEEITISRTNSSEEQTINNTFFTPKDGFFQAFVASISVILVSEIGDKTFFIAVILAMKHSRIMVFTGAVGALILMTALSAGLGQMSVLIPPVYIHYISAALFILFGLKMIKEGYSMSSADKSEIDEVQKTVQNRESKFSGDASSTVESGTKKAAKRARLVVLAMIFFEAFSMTFLAEWGDRSQLTTIVLAASKNVFGVILGAIVGHAACTLLAVLGGRVVADRISVKAVTIIGGIVFLGFAVWTLIAGYESDGDSLLDMKSSTIADEQRNRTS